MGSSIDADSAFDLIHEATIHSSDKTVGGHMLLTLWTLDCDPCFIPRSAVNTQ